MAEDSLLKEIKIKIAGDIVLADNPGRAMRKWREEFGISQIELAERMKVSASVVSDYESGRRKSPGARFVRRFVDTLIAIDVERGRLKLNELARRFSGSELLEKAVLDLREFDRPVTVREFCEAADAELVVGRGEYEENYIFGYTVVDSIRLVLDVPSQDYIKLYGMTTQRAAVFTKVHYGRSPMVAIKAMQAGMGRLKPALVVYHGTRKVDELGLEIARREKIPLAVSRIRTVEELIERLRKIE